MLILSMIKNVCLYFYHAYSGDVSSYSSSSSLNGLLIGLFTGSPNNGLPALFTRPAATSPAVFNE